MQQRPTPGMARGRANQQPEVLAASASAPRTTSAARRTPVAKRSLDDSRDEPAGNLSRAYDLAPRASPIRNPVGRTSASTTAAATAARNPATTEPTEIQSLSSKLHRCGLSQRIAYTGLTLACFRYPLRLRTIQDLVRENASYAQYGGECDNCDAEGLQFFYHCDRTHFELCKNCALSTQTSASTLASGVVDTQPPAGPASMTQSVPTTKREVHRAGGRNGPGPPSAAAAR
jgi:hypothetical protein